MRLLTGWNWVRVMYTGIGLYVAVQTGMAIVTVRAHGVLSESGWNCLGGD